ncbi:Omega-amidase NIT2 [Capsicum annuum]|nr:Omega-amidase NIT2 [Capsicum annuum]
MSRGLWQSISSWLNVDDTPLEVPRTIQRLKQKHWKKFKFEAVAASYGAHLICYPGAFNMTTGPLHWELLQRARAVDNQLYVATCAPARDVGGGYVAWGHSTLVGPFGEVLATTEHGEAIVISEIDYSQIEQRRTNLPLEKQRRGDLYQLVDVQRSSSHYCKRLGHTRGICYFLHGRSSKNAHIAQSNTTDDQRVYLSDKEYNEYLQYQASKHIFLPIASTAKSPTFGSWVADSGASDHISGDKSLLSDIVYSQSLPAITLANGIRTKPKGDHKMGQTIGIGHESQGLYHLTSSNSFTACSATDSPDLINKRLGHPSLSKLQKMVPSLSSLSTLDCESCQLGKHTCAIFSRSIESRLESIFSLVHSDIGGPSRVSPPLVFRYFVTFIDDFSRRTWVYLMKDRSELFSIFKSFCAEIQNQFGVSIRAFRSDNALEYLSSQFQEFMTYQGIIHQISCPAPDAFPTADLPLPSQSVSLQKGTRSTRNANPHYTFLSYHRLSSPHYDFVSSLSSISIPKTTGEALSNSGWKHAMIDEMSALHTSGTWDLVSLPEGKSTVGCRQVYIVKVGPDSQVDRLKARLVSKGYTQIFGLDYSDTCSAVAKIASVCLFLSMASVRHWPLYQLDIKNAFLHGDLEEEVYMEQTPSFVAQGESSSLVCRLRKSLYGLKQSPRAWFGKFSTVIQEFGMIRSGVDHSVFYVHSEPNLCIYLVVYVNDIVITDNDQDGITNLKQHLFQHFQTKDLGRLKYFPGIMGCRPTDTPMDPNAKLLPGQGEPLGDPERYRQLVGKLNYLTVTRPDISFPSKKQSVVPRSSAEAGYRTMTAATCELVWIKQLLRELKFEETGKMKLVCDNQTALHIASNPVFHEKTKHIEIDCHFVREKILSGDIVTKFVKSSDQLADIFTKSLTSPCINYICNKLGTYDLYASA